MKETENIKQARESFNRIIDNKKYANIIKDDKKYIRRDSANE